MKEVMSVGGSVLFKDGELNFGLVDFLSQEIYQYNQQGRSFCIVVGGGKTARYYQEYLQQGGCNSGDEQDRIGIEVTHLNAQLLDTLFRYRGLNSEYFRNSPNGNPVVITGGTVPGHTTDRVSVDLAIESNASRVINITNARGVCEPLPDGSFGEVYPMLTWGQYLSMIPIEHKPGLNVPFDPVASRISNDHNLRVDILPPNPYQNLKDCLSGNVFEGTVISNNP